MQIEILRENRQELVGRGEQASLRDAVMLPDGELAIEERLARAVRQGSRDHEAASEMRVGVGAGEPVGELAIDGGHLFQGKLVDVVPLGAQVRLVKEERALAHDAASLVRGGLLALHEEPDGRRQGESADADVGEPRFAGQLDAYEEVRARGKIVARPVNANTSAEWLGVEADRFEDRQKQAVLLETVAPATPADELLLKGGRREIDAPAQEDVEILEGNGPHVRVDDAVKRFERRSDGAAVSDPSEVSVDIDGLG